MGFQRNKKYKYLYTFIHKLNVNMYIYKVTVNRLQHLGKANRKQISNEQFEKWLDIYIYYYYYWGSLILKHDVRNGINKKSNRKKNKVCFCVLVRAWVRLCKLK